VLSDIFRRFEPFVALDTVNEWPYELAPDGPADSQAGREGGMSSMTLPYANYVVLPDSAVACRALSLNSNSNCHTGVSAGDHFCEGSTK